MDANKNKNDSVEQYLIVELFSTGEAGRSRQPATPDRPCKIALDEMTWKYQPLVYSIHK